MKGESMGLFGRKREEPLSEDFQAALKAHEEKDRVVAETMKTVADMAGCGPDPRQPGTEAASPNEALQSSALFQIQELRQRLSSAENKIESERIARIADNNYARALMDSLRVDLKEWKQEAANLRTVVYALLDSMGKDACVVPEHVEIVDIAKAAKAGR